MRPDLQLVDQEVSLHERDFVFLPFKCLHIVILMHASTCIYVAEYFRRAYAKVAFIVQHMYFKCNDIVFYPYYPNLAIFKSVFFYLY